MKTAQDLKQIVHYKYSQIARAEQSSCCGSESCHEPVYSKMNDDYSQLEGYHAGADLKLGCGLPTQFAHIKAGDTVLDLGSGAGNDCFVARHQCGSTGKVIGLDFSEAMLAKARKNATQLGFENIEFIYGDIEAMPLADHSVDIVLSNCVLNLVPDKARVFGEILRVLKPGGHFSISDIVLEGLLPPALRNEAELYAGCVSGAIPKSDYLRLIEAKGFIDIALQSEKSIELPQQILNRYLSEAEREAFARGSAGIFSISVFGRKPSDSKAP